jgi:hypothetical protein
MDSRIEQMKVFAVNLYDGWEDLGHGSWRTRDGFETQILTGWNTNSDGDDALPDYSCDLNAWNRLEMRYLRSWPKDMWDKYLTELGKICKTVSFPVECAPASFKLDAFLMAIGEWEEFNLYKPIDKETENK